jgi:hypothetical protein
MEIYTGIEFYADYLGIPEENFRIAHSFYSGNGSSKIYPDHWATGAATGIVNGLGNWSNFFASGRINFTGGNELISFENGRSDLFDFSLSDSTIFISFEKSGFGDNILFSSIGGSYPYFSGLCVGVNSANKLYLKYWDSVNKNSYTFIYKDIIPKKNLFFLNRNESNVSIGRFNTNSLEFDIQQFDIYQNSIIESDYLYIGGYYSNLVGLPAKNNYPWAFEGASNFNGYIDKFYFIYDMPSFYINDIGRSLFLNPTGQPGYYEENCFITGNLVDSGYFTTGVTGIYVSGYVDISTGVTGYRNLKSGWSKYGFTGFYDDIVGSYYDSCGRSHNITQSVSGFGYITGYDVIKLPLTGYIYTSGSLDIPLTGDIWNPTGIWVSGEICDDTFIPTGDIQFKIDSGYLNSLSYDKVSIINTDLLSLNTVGSPIDIFFEPSQYKKLNYNNQTTYVANNIYGTNL